MNQPEWHGKPTAIATANAPPFAVAALADWDRDEVRRATLDALPTHILTIDGDNRVVAANEPWRRFAAGAPLRVGAEGIGSDYLEICRALLGASDEQVRLIRGGLDAIRGGAQKELSLIVSNHAGGQERSLLLRATSLHVGKRSGVIIIHSDVSEHVRTERRLSHLAHHDALTGLPNRLLFRDRLQSALALSRRNHWLLAVLFLDLDRFKAINDTLGHDVGDRLLQEAARRLQKSVRDCDTICRFGGDEFALVLPELGDMHEAAQVPQRIVESLRAPVAIDEHELEVTASIGIALFPVDAEEPETLIRFADVAMYYAKKLGRNNYQFFTAAMNLDAAAPIKLR